MEYTLEQLKALIDSVAGYVVIYEVKDDAFYPLVYTKNVPSFSGLSEEEYLSLYKEDAAKVVPETDLPVLTQALQKAFALKEEQETVYRTYHKTKGFVWTHVFFKVLGTHGGNVVFLGSFSDASAASQEPKLLLDHSNQKIYVIERETYDLLYANAAARADKDHLPQLGDTCYKYIRQQNSPCGNCVIQHVQGEQPLSTIWYDPIRKKSYGVKIVPMNFFGKKAYANFIDDLTAHVEMEGKLHQEEEKYKAATEGANLRVYEYDIQSHTIILPEHAKKLFGVSTNVLPNIPDSILWQFHPQDYDRLRAFFRRIDEGKKVETEEFQMLPVNGYAPYLHFTFTPSYDETGRPVKAYAVAEDITVQKRAIDNFNETIRAVLSSNSNALCAYKLNLSKNECSEEHGSSEYIQNVLRANTADQLFKNLLSIIPDSSQHAGAEKFFDRTFLKIAFQAGKKSLSYDYQRYDVHHQLIWVRTYVNLLKRPDNEDIFAIFSSIDVTNEKRSEAVFNLITNQEYDFVVLLHTDTSKVEFLSLNSRLQSEYRDVFGGLGHLYDLDESRKYAAEHWVDAEDKEEYLERTTLTSIQKELDANGHFEISVRGHYREFPNEMMCRKIQHYYLDDQKTTILIIQSDVTETYQQQQKEINLAKEEAQRMEDIFNRLPAGICVLNMPDPEHVYTSFSNLQLFKMLELTDNEKTIQEQVQNRNSIVGKYFLDEFSGIHPDDLARMHELYRQGYSQKNFTTTNIRYLCGNGQYKYITTSLVLREINDKEHVFYAVYRDVSEEVALQKQLEKQRQEQMEKTLVSMIGSLPANYVLYRENEDGSLSAEKYSDEFCTMKGYTQETIRQGQGIDGMQPVYPHDRKALKQLLKDTHNDSLLHHAEYRISTKSGIYKWVSVNFSHVKIGAVKYVYAVYSDIDELKKQEQELEEQYNTALSFLNSVSGSYFATQRANLTKNTIEMTGGLDPLNLRAYNNYDETVQVLTDSMARESDRMQYTVKLSRASLMQAFKQGERTLPFTFMITLPSGNVRWVQHTITLAKQPGTEDIISFLAVRDISNEKFTNEVMAQIVSKKLDYICCISGRTGKIILFFTGMENASLNQVQQGVNYDEAVAVYNKKYMSPEDEPSCTAFMKLDHVKQELKEKDHAEGVFTCNEGYGTRVEHVEFFWLDKENDLIVLTRTDITETQRQQIEHEQALKAANKAKSDFLSRMSHDIRTPLNGIIGMTYLTKTEKDSNKIQDNLEKIDTSSKFLLGLINDVLDMSKAESGKIELYSEPYPTTEFMSYIDAVIKPLTAEKNQTLICSNVMPDGIVPILDKLRANQIFFNLLSNAVKYTPEGGTIQFNVSTKHLSDCQILIHAEVKDTGIGISKEFQRIIFDPFSQEGRNDISLQRGTGLGMAITKQLVTLMHGTIHVDSTLGKGSTFSVNLPAEILCEKNQPVSKPIQQASLDAMDDVLAGRHILLCEDHPLNQEIAKTLLEKKKLIVSTAEDGRIGAEMFQESIPNYYDVILMDIRMPVMDGYEATRCIRTMNRKDAKTVPIIAMTADAFADDVQKCLNAGMNSHLAKPIEPEVLYETLYKAIVERQKKIHCQ